MPTRFVISRVIGTGTQEDPYRVKAQDVVTAQAVSLGQQAKIEAFIPSRPDGSPRFGWGVCRVVVGAGFTIPADSEIDVIPTIDATGAGLDSALSAAYTTTQFNNFKTRLTTRFPLCDFTDLARSSTVRFLMRKLARHVIGDSAHSGDCFS